MVVYIELTVNVSERLIISCVKAYYYRLDGRVGVKRLRRRRTDASTCCLNYAHFILFPTTQRFLSSRFRCVLTSLIIIIKIKKLCSVRTSIHKIICQTSKKHNLPIITSNYTYSLDLTTIISKILKYINSHNHKPDQIDWGK